MVALYRIILSPQTYPSFTQAATVSSVGSSDADGVLLATPAVLVELGGTIAGPPPLVEVLFIEVLPPEDPWVTTVTPPAAPAPATDPSCRDGFSKPEEDPDGEEVPPEGKSDAGGEDEDTDIIEVGEKDGEFGAKNTG